MEQIKDLVSLNRQTQVNRIVTCSSKAYALIARSLQLAPSKEAPRCLLFCEKSSHLRVDACEIIAMCAFDYLIATLELVPSVSLMPTWTCRPIYMHYKLRQLILLVLWGWWLVTDNAIGHGWLLLMGQMEQESKATERWPDFSCLLYIPVRSQSCYPCSRSMLYYSVRT
jgi:hypothetical protein